MKIEWLGHSSFKLTESTGISVVTDPYDGDKLGICYPNVSADYITISHKHFDHDAIHNVNGYKSVIDVADTHQLEGITFIGFTSCHDSKKGALRGQNIIYKIIMDGIEVCHLGDIGEQISPAIAQFIGHTNILMVPIGGNYTIDAVQAKDYIDMLMPDIVIPMHYKVEGCESDIDGLDNFLRLFDNNTEYAKGELVFDRTSFDGKTTRVIVPDRLDCRYKENTK